MLKKRHLLAKIIIIIANLIYIYFASLYLPMMFEFIFSPNTSLYPFGGSMNRVTLGMWVQLIFALAFAVMPLIVIAGIALSKQWAHKLNILVSALFVTSLLALIPINIIGLLLGEITWATIWSTIVFSALGLTSAIMSIYSLDDRKKNSKK